MTTLDQRMPASSNIKLPGSVFQQPMLQVGSLGSRDPNFQSWQKQQSLPQSLPGTFGNIPLGGSNLHSRTPPMNPILDKFSQMLTGNTGFRQQLYNNPGMQASLFDIDNLIKANAGISRTKQEGYLELGVDADGNRLWAAPELQNESQNFRLGENQLAVTGQLLDAMGGFRTPEEAQQFAQYTKIAGSPELQGILTRKVAEEGPEAATNYLLQSMGKPTLDALKDPDDASGVATAFGAFNIVNNWDKMNAAQRSMAVSGLAINGYKYATGENLTDRVLIAGRGENDPTLTVGQAMGLASTGVNVMELMKNWDQLDALQRLTYGAGSASQMASIAKQFGLLGPADQTGKITGEQLGRLGYQAAPSVGVGAIVGPSSSVPDGYTVVSAGHQPNTVIAVPKGQEGTVATMNGSTQATTLNNVAGGTMAGLGALQVYHNWGKGGLEGAYNGIVGGSVMAQGLAQMGQTNPYMLGGIVALSALSGMVGEGTAAKLAGGAAIGATGVAAYQAATGGAQAASGAAAGAGAANSLGAVAAGAGAAYGTYKALDSDAPNDVKAKGVRDSIGSSAAAYYTFGLSALGQYADKEWFGGKGQKFVDKTEKYVSLGGSVLVDKALEAGIGMFGGRTQNAEHMARDKVRGGLKSSGFLDDGYNVTLANGQKAYAGFDDKDGQHEFRDPSKLPKGAENRTLSAYDVDYTNDLDFSAHLMTSSLMRIMAGGKGTPIDQVAGQLANAAISQVGYGQDLTEDTFAATQANVRAFFHQNGVKSKEDAYALANQMFAEQRITEMDLLGVHQGINMAFDEDGYSTAQMLMAGRWKGIEVAHEVHPIGPNMHSIQAPAMVQKPLRITGSNPEGNALQEIAQETASPGVELNMHPGMYWGQPTSGLYRTAMQEYRDPFMQQTGGR